MGSAHRPSAGNRRFRRRQGHTEYIYNKPYVGKDREQGLSRLRRKACRRTGCRPFDADDSLIDRPEAAAREAGDAGFDVLITCALNYDVYSAEFDKLGRIPVLKARMNPDLHMGAALKNTGAGNLFVIFGEPNINILCRDEGLVQVKINGVDIFHPSTGKSNPADQTLSPCGSSTATIKKRVFSCLTLIFLAQMTRIRH